MKLELEPKDITLIRQGLGKLPFDDVAQLIVDIQNQVAKQLEPQKKETGEK